MLTLQIVFVEGDFDPISDVCRINMPIWLMGVAVLSDIFIVLAISIVFCRRLLLVNLTVTANLTDTGSNVSDATTPRKRTLSANIVSTTNFTFEVMRKSLVLVMVALLTTPTSIFLGATFGLIGFWVAMDFAISCWTVMLMFAKHNWIYEYLCQRLEGCITVTCLSYYSCFCCEDYCCCCTHQLEEAATQRSSSPPQIDIGDVPVPETSATASI